MDEETAIAGAGNTLCMRSSIGRMVAFQAIGCWFESSRMLHKNEFYLQDLE